MADQKVVDKNAKKIAGLYGKSIKDIVNTLTKGKKSLSVPEFTSAMMALDMNKIATEHLKGVGNEYVKAHRDVLKTVNPFGKTKDND